MNTLPEILVKEHEGDIIRSTSTTKAAKCSAITTITHIGKALEWAGKNEYEYIWGSKMFWHHPTKEDVSTTDLVNKYFESLK